MLRDDRLRAERAGGLAAARVNRRRTCTPPRPGHSPSPIPYRKRFEIDGKDVLRAINEFDDAGWELGAIYHSHTHTAPYPSQTDINFARNWPGVEWLIVGLADGRSRRSAAT